MFLEHGGEMGLVIESHSVGHLCDIDLLLTDETGSLLQSEVTDEVAGRDTCDLLHLAVQLGTTDTHLLGELLHVEIGILDVLVDTFHDTIHQHIVVAFHLYLLHFLLLCLGTRELTAQTAHIINKVVDEDVQFFHVERLGNESISTTLQSFKTVAHLRARRQ